MTGWTSKLGAVTLAQLSASICRGLAWLFVIALTGWLLDLVWSWRLVVLCIASDFASYVIYPNTARSTSSDS